LGPWTTFAAATSGCSCSGGPTYYVVVRDGRKLHRDRVGPNRKAAERALRKIGTQVDEGEYRPQTNIKFGDWAKRWLKSLERKAPTVDSYRGTMTYAKTTFGDKIVRRITTEDVLRFNQKLRDVVVVQATDGRPERRLSASTRAKHMRVLGTCLRSAVMHGY